MYRQFEEKIKYKFKDKKILRQAFTHSSFAYEKKMKTYESNERLEFLGDAVLEITVSNYIYNKYKQVSEGELTKMRAVLVCEPTLAHNARKLSIGKWLRLGKGEEQTGGKDRESILADTLEAIIGAIYIDGNLEDAEKFILEVCIDNIDEQDFIFNDVDYKTNLQEHFQKISKEPLKYNTVNETGPDHDKTFTVELIHENKFLGAGMGKNKKEAEQNAAFIAIEKINKRG